MSKLATPLKESWARKDIIFQLSYKEITGRYRGSIIGLTWSLLNPLMMLAIYTIAFQDILNVRWEQSGESRGGFATFLFAGLIVHGLFSECLNRAPSLILENPNYVKKVPFPLQVLAWVLLGSAMFHTLASTLVLAAFKIVLDGTLPVTALLVPLILIPPAIFLLGIIWLLAASGVYLRDISQFMPLVSTALLFLSPVFYPMEAMPSLLASIMTFNPLALIIEQMRLLVLMGMQPDWSALVSYTAFSLFVALSGLVLFQKARRGFVEVM